jgi:hypothetical protein
MPRVSRNDTGSIYLNVIKLAPQPKEAASEVLLTRAEVARRWKCSSTTVRRWEKKGLNPIARGKKWRRYRLSDVERFEAEGSTR